MQEKIKSFMMMQNDIYLLKTVGFEFKIHPIFGFLVYNQKENKVFSFFFPVCTGQGKLGTFRAFKKNKLSFSTFSFS